MSNPNPIATLMRKLAAELRKESEVQERKHAEKCATILVAARGLSTLQQLIGGGSRGN